MHITRPWCPTEVAMPWYPADAPLPPSLHTREFLLRPLRAADAQLDYDAVIASRAQLLVYSGGR